MKTLNLVLFSKNKGVNQFYKTFKIQKKSGGARTISAPKDQLILILTRLSDKLIRYYINVRKKSNKKIRSLEDKIKQEKDKSKI